MPAENFVINIVTTGDEAAVASQGRVAAASREMGAAAKGASAAQATGLAATEARWKSAGATATATGKKLNRGLTLPILAIGAVSGKLSIDFEKSMRNVNSIAQLPEPTFQRLNSQVLNMAGKVAQAPITLSEGLYDLVSSGFKAGEAIGILEASAKAATAGLTTTEVSTKAVAAALNAYHRPAADATQISDDLFQTVNLGVVSFDELASTIGYVLPAAATMGVGIKQVGASISTLTKEGQSGSNAVTNINAALTAFIKPSKAMKGVLKELGYETSQQLIQQHGFQGALEIVTEAVHGNKEAIGALFPNVRAMRAVFGLTGDSAASAAKDLRGFKNDAGATNKVLHEQQKSLAYDWNQLKAEASVLGIEIGKELIPVLRDLGHDVAGAVHWFGSLPPEVQSSTIKVLAFGAALGPILRIGGAFATMIGGIASGMKWIAGLNIVGELGAALSLAKAGEMGGIAMVGKELATKLVGGLGTALPIAVAAAGLGNIIYSATKGDWHDAGFKAGGALVGGIAGAFLGGPAGAALGAGAGSFVGGLLGDLFDDGGQSNAFKKRTEETVRSAINGHRQLIRSSHQVVAAERALSRTGEKQKDVTRALKATQDRLNAARKSGDTARVRHEEARLNELKAKQIHLTHQQWHEESLLHAAHVKNVDDARRARTVEVALVRTRQAQLEQAQKHERQARKQFEQAVLNNKPLKEQNERERDLIEAQKRRKGASEKLTASEKELGGTMKEIADKFGEKFADKLRKQIPLWHQTAAQVKASGEALQRLAPSIKPLSAQIKAFGERGQDATKKVQHGAQQLREKAPADLRRVGRGYTDLAQTGTEGLGVLGTNTNNFLKSLNANPLSFTVTTPKAGGKGQNRGGITRVPGIGREDSVPLYGRGIEAVVAPGEDLIVANRHQRPELDYAVRNTFGDAGLEGFFKRSNRPHKYASGGIAKKGTTGTTSDAMGVQAAEEVLRKIGMASGMPLPKIAGPPPLATGAQHSVNLVFAAAADYLKKHAGSPKVRAMIRFAEQQAAKNYPYVYGGGHGSFSGPYDCSGFVSAILHAGGFLDTPMSVQQGSGLYTFGLPGAGDEVTWGVRGSSGMSAHTMISLKDIERGWRFFESGSGHGAAEVGGWSGSFAFRHPQGFARGGIMPTGTDLSKMPAKARQRLAKYGSAALDPRSPYFIGWGYNQGGVLAFNKGGTFTASDVKHSGQLTPFEAGIAMLLGGFPPSVRYLSEGLGTIKGENNFTLPNDAQGPGGHIGLWSESPDFGSAAERLNPVTASKLAERQWASDGKSFYPAWGRWQAEQSGHDGAKAFGPEMVATAKKLINVNVAGGAGAEEDVPAVFHGAKTGTIDFPPIPKTLHGIQKQINHWGNGGQITLYRHAVKAAKGKPKIQRALEKNVTAIETYLGQLRDKRSLLRREAAKKKAAARLRKKLGKITGVERQMEEAERTYTIADQTAGQIVDMEPLPPELKDDATEAERKAAEEKYLAAFQSYIDQQERPAYGAVLDSLAVWRNLTIHGEQTATRLEDGFEKEVREVDHEIDLINAFTEKVAHDKEDWKKAHPKADFPKWIKEEIKKDHKERARLPVLRFRDHEIRNVLGEAREAFWRGKKEGVDPIQPPPVPMPGSGTFEDTLGNIQGVHWPDQHEQLGQLPGRRSAGQFGGAIWDVQGTIEELGLKVNQAVGSVGGGGGGGGLSEIDQERLELIEAENAQLKREKLIRLAQAPVLQNYLGAYEKGGILPETGFYLGHKGEEVVPADQVGQNDGGVTVLEPHIHLSGATEALEGMIDARVELRDKRTGRTVGVARATPSAPGRKASYHQGSGR